MWRHLARPVGKGHRHSTSFARWVSGLVGDQGQDVMQTGLVVVEDQGANMVGVVSKTNGDMACKMGGVGRESRATCYGRALRFLACRI